MTQMKRIALVNRPVGEPQDSDFSLETGDIPSAGEGQVVVETHYLSLDPYMRGRMDDAKSYSAPVPLGGTMEGGAVGQVIESNSDLLAVGDYVFGMLGWASHAVMNAKELRKLDPNLAPITTALGVMGMPGFTGWYGLTELGKPKAGETLVVAAATGPVGSMVGQIAKARGLRTVGIAGGAEKCALAVEKFGFDACIDHTAYDDASSLRKAVAEAAPNGIDIYFENVAGKVLDAVLPLMNVHGRIPLCGMISWYNAGGLGANAGEAGIDNMPRLWRTLLVSRLQVSGFIISDHWDRYPEFLRDVGPMLGKEVAYQEDITQGLENAPQAFRNLLSGKNFGKQIVQVKA